jgi:hypothetical protein
LPRLGVCLHSCQRSTYQRWLLAAFPALMFLSNYFRTWLYIWILKLGNSLKLLSH